MDPALEEVNITHLQARELTPPQANRSQQLDKHSIVARMCR